MCEMSSTIWWKMHRTSPDGLRAPNMLVLRAIQRTQFDKVAFFILNEIADSKRCKDRECVGEGSSGGRSSKYFSQTVAFEQEEQLDQGKRQE